MPSSISSSASVNPKFSYEAALDATPVQLFQGRGNLYGMILEDNTGSVTFLQVFDAASTGDVTVGVTVPKLTLRMPASGAFGRDPSDIPYAFFEKGCVVVATTTRTGSTSPSPGSSCTFWYMNMKTFG